MKIIRSTFAALVLGATQSWGSCPTLTVSYPHEFSESSPALDPQTCKPPVATLTAQAMARCESDRSASQNSSSVSSNMFLLDRLCAMECVKAHCPYYVATYSGDSPCSSSGPSSAPPGNTTSQTVGGQPYTTFTLGGAVFAFGPAGQKPPFNLIGLAPGDQAGLCPVSLGGTNGTITTVTARYTSSADCVCSDSELD